MTTESNKTLIRKWIDEGWNKGNAAIIDEVYATNFVQHDPGSPLPVNSAETFKLYFGGYQQALPDLRFTIDDLVAEGDKVLWRFTATGTHGGPLMGIPATGKQAAVTGMALFRIADNRIAEAWINFDALGLLQQIGAIPVPA